MYILMIKTFLLVERLQDTPFLQLKVLKKKVEDRKKKDAQFVATKTKGVRFYDKKGKGRIVKGRKIYD